MEKCGVIGAKDVYVGVFEMIVNAENVSWNRFYNFLWFNSILIVSWATVWASSNRSTGSSAFLIGVCVLGMVSGVFWWGLGYRGRKFLNLFVEKGVEIENDSMVWADGSEKYRSMCKDIDSYRKSLGWGWAGSWWVLQFGPVVVSLFYLYMLCLTLWFGY